LRTIFEIQRWGSYSAEEKAVIMWRIEQRWGSYSAEEKAVIMWRIKERGRRKEIRYEKTESVSTSTKGPDGSKSGLDYRSREVR
jgi:predicted Fe-S protein YdhL (DUF1289 family)